MVQRAPKGLRLHIGIFGRRNVGKSSVLNAITRQQVSIVSDIAGTTTDPVEKPMELLPLGPVLFIDTAGIDDVGALGAERVAKTRKVIDRTDLGVIVADSGEWGEFEEGIVAELKKRNVPAFVVFNKSDLGRPAPELEARLHHGGIRSVQAAVVRGEGVLAVRDALIAAAPDDFLAPDPIIGDLLTEGGLAVLVVPIDKEAPKGRI